MIDRLNVFNRALFIPKEVYENIKFENLNTLIDYTDIDRHKLVQFFLCLKSIHNFLPLYSFNIFSNLTFLHNCVNIQFYLISDQKVKYKIIDSNETDKYLVQHVLFNANQIHHNVEYVQHQLKDIVYEKPEFSKVRNLPNPN